MKRCPSCNRNFIDENLSYCTDDGTPLVEQEGSSSFDPQATLLSPPPPTTGNVNEPLPTQAYRAGEMPGGMPEPHSWSGPPSVPPPAPAPQSWSGQQQQQQQSPSWSPPPPPGTGFAAKKSGQNPLAIASLGVGVFSLTIGLCCYLGLLTGPVAVVLGIVAMVQMKNNVDAPQSSKGMAIGGIATGALAMLVIMLLFILGVALGGR
jgi:hypothetical protein